MGGASRFLGGRLKKTPCTRGCVSWYPKKLLNTVGNKFFKVQKIQKIVLSFDYGIFYKSQRYHRFIKKKYSQKYHTPQLVNISCQKRFFFKSVIIVRIFS